MTGGGTVLIGGDFQGKNAAIRNAQYTYVGKDATVKADAIDSGDGGKVIVWADDTARSYGQISARGGRSGLPLGAGCSRWNASTSARCTSKSA